MLTDEMRVAYRKKTAEMADMDTKTREAMSALRVALMSAKTAIRQQQRLQEAIHAQETSHLEAIKQLQEEHRKAKEDHRTVKEAFRKTKGVSATEADSMRQEIEELRESCADANQKIFVAERRVEEHLKENAALQAGVHRADQERLDKSQELKSLHVAHLAETSRLKAIVSELRSDLETGNTDSAKRIERLEAALTSVEFARTQADAKHAAEMRQLETKLSEKATSAIAALNASVEQTHARREKVHQETIELLNREHRESVVALESKITDEALARRESAKTSEHALVRLREVMDLEREEQMQELLQEKETAAKIADDRFEIEALRHKENHRQLRAQLTAAHDRLAALEVGVVIDVVNVVVVSGRY